MDNEHTQHVQPVLPLNKFFSGLSSLGRRTDVTVVVDDLAWGRLAVLGVRVHSGDSFGLLECVEHILLVPCTEVESCSLKGEVFDCAIADSVAL
jgi:hypothetical protein